MGLRADVQHYRRQADVCRVDIEMTRKRQRRSRARAARIENLQRTRDLWLALADEIERYLGDDDDTVEVVSTDNHHPLF